MTGAINPAVTPPAIQITICRPHWSAEQRPPVAYTQRIKRRLLPAGTRSREWILDHVVPIDLGGDARSPANLQLQTPSEAHRKDRLEAVLHRMVCKGKVSLPTAQGVFLGGWERGYGRWVRHAD